VNEIKRILILNRTILHYQKVLHAGVSLAKKYNARIYIMHVFHNPFSAEEWGVHIPKGNSRQKLYSEIRKRAQRELDAIISLKKAQGIIIKEILREDASADDIKQVVKMEKIDLLVMLAHKEGRIEQFVFHPDKNQILRQMPCSVLLVKEDSNFDTERTK